jgi:hypothetical protein
MNSFAQNRERSERLNTDKPGQLDARKAKTLAAPYRGSVTDARLRSLQPPWSGGMFIANKRGEFFIFRTRKTKKRFTGL